MPGRTRWRPLLAALLLPLTALTACSSAAGPDAASGAGSAVTVTVGYQSKTINTVTAGTLLRSLGTFEQRLQALGERTGTTYRVQWEDYPTGAQITAQMLAAKIDIGSMGDYPLLINGSRGQSGGERTVLLAVTGYNNRGALNSVVVRPDSPATGLADLRGKPVSTSVGSAAHGLLVQALKAQGLDPKTDVSVQNQDPAVGASALASGAVAGLSQFVAWPGLLVFQNQAKLIYDGGALNVPTLHGTVARSAFVAQRPEVADEFLRAQIDATRYLHEHPLDAAKKVAEATGLPPEVVYLYNGAGGVATFDTTIKPAFREVLKSDTAFLSSIGNIQQLDLDAFVDDRPLRRVYGPDYDRDLAVTTNPAPISGRDTVCNVDVTDPATAAELWVGDEPATRPAATPTCLLRAVAAAKAAGHPVRAGYVPDAGTGTRWYADHSVWLRDPAAAPTARYLPFATESAARGYAAAHPGSTPVTYADAVTEAGGQP
jgi:NitT/TauT family transport system substrate-binding protein